MRRFQWLEQRLVVGNEIGSQAAALAAGFAAGFTGAFSLCGDQLFSSISRVKYALLKYNIYSVPHPTSTPCPHNLGIRPAVTIPFHLESHHLQNPHQNK